MSHAIDLRKPRVVYGHPKVKPDYAHMPQRPTTRKGWVIAYVLVILHGVAFVATVGTMVYVGKQISQPHSVTGHP